MPSSTRSGSGAARRDRPPDKRESRPAASGTADLKNDDDAPRNSTAHRAPQQGARTTGRLSLSPEVAAVVKRRLGIATEPQPEPLPAPEIAMPAPALWAEIASGCAGVAAFDEGSRIRALKVGVRLDLVGRFPGFPARSCGNFSRGIASSRCISRGAPRAPFASTLMGARRAKSAPNRLSMPPKSCSDA